ncbi:MAG TPA: NUDIX hydrolase [Candidatus Kapabacteria bacterium]|nr:NUDIX hydrolase [Candidatus Kapabacteria bacterium]
MNQMLTISRDDRVFQYRAVAIALQGGRILLHKTEDDWFWSPPGGRCEMGESAEQTVRREMVEEMGAEPRVVRPLWVAENFFTYQGRRCHELGIYFLVEFPPETGVPDRGDRFVGSEGATPLLFEWFNIDSLESIIVKPGFLAANLRSVSDSLRFISHDDGVNVPSPAGDPHIRP